MVYYREPDHELAENIIRIQKMEQYFDEVTEAVNSNPNLIQNDVKIQEKLQELIDYYESDLWLQDYECDERGELPNDLKRGILSEDGLYNLLCEVKFLGVIENELG